MKMKCSVSHCFTVRKWTAKTLIWLEAGAFEILWDLTLEWFLSDNKLCAFGNYIMSGTFGFVYNFNEVLKGRLTKHFLVRPLSFVLFRKLFYHLSVFSLDWKKEEERIHGPALAMHCGFMANGHNISVWWPVYKFTHPRSIYAKCINDMIVNLISLNI